MVGTAESHTDSRATPFPISHGWEHNYQKFEEQVERVITRTPRGRWRPRVAAGLGCSKSGSCSCNVTCRTVLFVELAGATRRHSRPGPELLSGPLHVRKPVPCHRHELIHDLRVLVA